MAGAQWMSFATQDEIAFQNWDKPAYHEFLRLAESEPTSGIQKVEINLYVTKEHSDKYVSPWFKHFVKDYRELTPENFKFPSSDLVKGHLFTTVTITTPHYLAYLQSEIIKLGGTVSRVNVSSLDEANKFHHSGKVPDLIVNASGYLAKYLAHDDKMYPIKGQIVIIRNSCSRQYVIEEGLNDAKYSAEPFYIFPRKEGGCIVGGIYEPVDNFDETIDADLTNRILARAKKYVPELLDDTKFKSNKKELDVVTQYTAFRPARKGGIRVERQGKVIHNYGAGGTGYQSSYGTAENVVKLANQFTQRGKL